MLHSRGVVAGLLVRAEPGARSWFVCQNVVRLEGQLIVEYFVGRSCRLDLGVLADLLGGAWWQSFLF